MFKNKRREYPIKLVIPKTFDGSIHNQRPNL